MGQNVFLFPVGNNDGYTFVGNFLCNTAFSQHTTPSERRLTGLYVFGKVLFPAVYFADNGRGRIGRISVVDAVDITQDDKCIHPHHGGDQSRQFVVVREHQFCNGYRIVFVYDWYHVIVEHHFHAMFLVEIMRAAAEILFRSEHLAAGDLMFAEQFEVTVDQFGLAYCGVELAG